MVDPSAGCPLGLGNSMPNACKWNLNLEDGRVVASYLYIYRQSGANILLLCLSNITLTLTH